MGLDVDGSPSTRSPTRTVMHGTLPPPGVWSVEGYGKREAKMSFSKTFIPKHEIAMDAKGGGDFLYANTFFNNGLVAGSQEGIRSRDLHLGHDLVPLAPRSNNMPSRSSSSNKVERHPSPPGRRISAIEFDDGAWAGSPVAAHSPQRVPVEGAWRLTSMLSSPELATVQHHQGVTRQVVPQQARNMQLVNRSLYEAKARGARADRERKLSEERSALADFAPRWGFLESGNIDELVSRRRAPAQHHISRPTLPGFEGFSIGARAQP